MSDSQGLTSFPFYDVANSRGNSLGAAVAPRFRARCEHSFCSKTPCSRDLDAYKDGARSTQYQLAGIETHASATEFERVWYEKMDETREIQKRPG